MGRQKKLQPIDGELIFADPTPRHAKIDLHDLASIRREMAAVYRDMRGGKIETGDGTKLAYVLNLLGQAHEREDLESRVTALESKPQGYTDYDE
jgi:hypothetical protein